MDTKHTSARCKNCKWVHEADSIKGTSYMGVELCLQHAAAPELLEALRTIIARIDGTNMHTPIKDMRDTWNLGRAAIARATS